MSIFLIVGIVLASLPIAVYVLLIIKRLIHISFDMWRLNIRSAICTTDEDAQQIKEQLAEVDRNRDNLFKLRWK